MSRSRAILVHASTRLWRRRAGFILAAVASLMFAATSAAQSAGPHRLTLIQHNDEAFDHLVLENYPGFQDIDGYKAMLPYLVLLRNDTPYKVRAYAVAWEIESPGIVNRAMNQFIQRDRVRATALPFAPGEWPTNEVDGYNVLVSYQTSATNAWNNEFNQMTQTTAGNPVYPPTTTIQPNCTFMYPVNGGHSYIDANWIKMYNNGPGLSGGVYNGAFIFWDPPTGTTAGFWDPEDNSQNYVHHVCQTNPV